MLSEDYFSVADADIPQIESLLTVVGGRIVYAAGEFGGLEELLPPVTPSWSPAARFGGYQAMRHRRSGVGQADAVIEAAADSAEQESWRAARGMATTRTELGDCIDW